MGSYLRYLLVSAVLCLLASVALYMLYTSSIGGEEVGELEGEILLPLPRLKGEMSVEEAISRRRSVREYTDEPLSLEEVAQLLWSAQGITEPNREFRAAPSAGATYPLILYLVVREGGVKGLRAGIYRYDTLRHSLKIVKEGDYSSELSTAALGQPWVREAPVNIVFTAVYERTTIRYGERGIRYVHMEVGHAAQNVYLQATAMKLGTVVVGAFRDEEVLRI